MKRLKGWEAIAYAQSHDLTLHKYEDPTEDAREGLSVAQARRVALEDPALIYLEVDLPAAVLARWDAADWDAARMVARRYRYEDAETHAPLALTDEEAGLYVWGQTEEDVTGGAQAGRLP